MSISRQGAILEALAATLRLIDGENGYLNNLSAVDGRLDRVRIGYFEKPWDVAGGRGNACVYLPVEQSEPADTNSWRDGAVITIKAWTPVVGKHTGSTHIASLNLWADIKRALRANLFLKHGDTQLSGFGGASPRGLVEMLDLTATPITQEPESAGNKALGWAETTVVVVAVWHEARPAEEYPEYTG